MPFIIQDFKSLSLTQKNYSKFCRIRIRNEFMGSGSIQLEGWGATPAFFAGQNCDVWVDVQVREVGDQGQQAGVGAHHLRGPPPLHVPDPGTYRQGRCNPDPYPYSLSG